MPFPQSWLSSSRVSAQCRKQPTIRAVVHCWLTAHPTVASSMVFYHQGVQDDWTHWPAALQHDLADKVRAFLKWFGDGQPAAAPRSFTTPIPRDAPGDPIYGGLVMDYPRARNVYLAHAAISLALELSGALPWSITNYSHDHLRLLFDWNDMFQYISTADSQFPGYYLMTLSSPARPSLVVRFLKQHQLLGTDTTDTVSRLFGWCGDLRHYYAEAPLTVPDPHLFWGPDAPPIPVSMVIKGTTYTGPSGPKSGRYTMGCTGTSEFFKSVLRIVNVPVEVRYEPSGHVMPYFPTIHRALSHGDDPYNALTLVSAFPGWPQPALKDYLITGAQWTQWFGAGVNPLTSQHNVGRRVAELAVKYQSDQLLNLYCEDVAAQASHASGKVFQTMSYFYTLHELETKQLWHKLGAKATATGFCA